MRAFRQIGHRLFRQASSPHYDHIFPGRILRGCEPLPPWQLVVRNMIAFCHMYEIQEAFS